MEIYLNPKTMGELALSSINRVSVERERNRIAHVLREAGRESDANNVMAVFAGSAWVKLLPCPRPGEYFITPLDPNEAAGYAYNLIMFSTPATVPAP